MVSPSETAMESEKNGMPRFALSEPSIGSTTKRGRPTPMRPTSSETTAPAASRTRARMTSSAAWSIAVVSSPPSPAPTTGSRSARVGIRSRTAPTSATAARQSSGQSVKWQHQQAGRELRIEERALLRHDVAAARGCPDVLEAGRPQEEGGFRLAAVDGGDRLLAMRRVGDPARGESIDHLRVEKAVPREQLVAPAAIEHRPREVLEGRVDRHARRIARALGDPVRREDRQALLSRRDDHRKEPRRRITPVLLVEGDRSLVAVVPVRDQELRVCKLLRKGSGELRVQPP